MVTLRREMELTQTEADVGTTARRLEVNYLRTELETVRSTLRQAQESVTAQTLDNATTMPIAQNPILPLMVAERPRTVAETLAFTTAPVIVTTAEYPFRIVHTNAAWSEL